LPTKCEDDQANYGRIKDENAGGTLAAHKDQNVRVTWPHPCVAALFVAAVLLADRDGLAAQLLLAMATAAFVWLFCRQLRIPAVQVLCCIAVATLGEVLLSVGWGLYSYRHAVIPLYVPPGHALLYALAVATSRHPRLREHERAITRTVLIAGSVIAMVTLIAFDDTWGLLWWLAAVALISRSHNRLMLSVCMTYTMLLEWAGTANGNWHWAATVPFLGLHCANPPSGVGVLYVLLDVIVIALTTRIVAQRAALASASLSGGSQVA
jgi:hypothetical protein